MQLRGARNLLVTNESPDSWVRELAMFVVVALIGLALQLTNMAVQLSLQLILMAGRALAWTYREVVVPGVHATAEGVMRLAAIRAQRRSERQVESPRWTDDDDRAVRRLTGRGE